MLADYLGSAPRHEAAMVTRLLHVNYWRDGNLCTYRGERPGPLLGRGVIDLEMDNCLDMVSHSVPLPRGLGFIDEETPPLSRP
jgi:hypothetical protein